MAAKHYILFTVRNEGGVRGNDYLETYCGRRYGMKAISATGNHKAVTCKVCLRKLAAG